MKNGPFFFSLRAALFIGVLGGLLCGAPLSAADTAAMPGNTGRIAGTLGYPSDAIPPMIVVAFQSDNLSRYQKIETAPNQSAFALSNLLPGAYVVVAYPKGDGSLQGGYSKAVPCGLKAGCSDHSLIPVTVEAGKTASGVEVKDWYAPENAFPPKPK